MISSRRKFLQALVATAVLIPLSKAHALAPLTASGSSVESNFRYIYDNVTYRQEFYQFLTNVFHLYPEDEMDQLITSVSAKHVTDEAIYRELQNTVAEIKPFLADIRYALPALGKQKKEMARQTQALLGDSNRFENYLEIGTIGRYVDALEESFKIKGERYFINERPPGYSLVDILDRGQIIKAGEYIALNDYQTAIAQTIPNNSLELVTVFIGFHHCPVPLREAFITSIRDAMKPGASLILRDHDAKNEKMLKLVGLAHDVFNMGTRESWNYNSNERRHFYSLASLDKMLTQFGFKTDGRRLLQTGDPTMNTLMLYKKA